jgi:hypothetical protein
MAPLKFFGMKVMSEHRGPSPLRHGLVEVQFGGARQAHYLYQSYTTLGEAPEIDPNNSREMRQPQQPT